MKPKAPALLPDRGRSGAQGRQIGHVAPTGVVFGHAVAHDAVDDFLVGIVGLEVNAGLGGGAGRVAHDCVLDQQVLGGDDANALAVVLVADDVLDEDVLVGDPGLAAAQVDAVAAAFSEGEAQDLHVGAAMELHDVTPFGALVAGGVVVIGAAHAQRGAIAAEGDILDHPAAEKRVIAALELVGLGEDLDALLEGDLLVADELDRGDDPGLPDVVHGQLRHAGVDGGLQARGGVSGVEAPPGGLRFLELAGGDVINRLLVDLGAGTRERHG
jgi:hypothetical protein